MDANAVTSHASAMNGPASILSSASIELIGPKLLWLSRLPGSLAFMRGGPRLNYQIKADQTLTKAKAAAEQRAIDYVK